MKKIKKLKLKVKLQLLKLSAKNSFKMHSVFNCGDIRGQ